MVRREYPERPIAGVGGVVIHNERALLIRRGRRRFRRRVVHTSVECWRSWRHFLAQRGASLEETATRKVPLTSDRGVRARVTRDAVFSSLKYHFVILDYLCEAARGDAQAVLAAPDVRLAVNRS